MSCDTAGGLLIYYYINFGIKLIMIIAPIILLVLGTIDFMGAVTAGDEKGMKKSIQTFLKRMLICVLILVLPTIISLIMSFSPKESTLFNCLDKATKENVKKLEKEREEETNKYSEIQNEIKEFTNGEYNENKYNELLNKVNSVENQFLKALLKYQLDEFKEVSNTSNTSSETTEQSSTESGVSNETNGKRVPTAPTDRRVNTVGNALSGLNICDLLKEKGSSCDKLSADIRASVLRAGVGKRQAAVAAVTTLINTLNGYGYKINYEWAGKYKHIGINGNWGNVLSTAKYNSDCNSYSKTTNSDGANCWNNMQWFGLDCSGLVEWALVQATQNESIDYWKIVRDAPVLDFYGKNMKNVTTWNKETTCDIGDTIHRQGHVAIIIGKDNVNKTYKIAESSAGVTYNTVSYTGGNGWLYCRRLQIYSDK